MHRDTHEEDFTQGATICVSHAVVEEQGEDSHGMARNGQEIWLCVADGCGGMGGRRYDRAEQHTGAYLASRFAVEWLCRWFAAEDRSALPETREQGRALCGELAQKLHSGLMAFEGEHGNVSCRIVGSMQRTLPTTVCAAWLRPAGGQLECLYLWAGDSRGYVWDADGLHQVTRDDSHGMPDAMESLYADARLDNFLNADSPFILHAHRFLVRMPCVLLTATDGAFAYLPNPMEFEQLLLDTLMQAENMERWREGLSHALRGAASDDCTIVAALYGYATFEEVKKTFGQRKARLNRRFTLPIRKQGFASEVMARKWNQYRPEYDWTEGVPHGDGNWRI